MCTVAVKRRLAMVPSFCLANSYSVLPAGYHDRFVRRREYPAETKRILRFPA